MQRATSIEHQDIKSSIIASAGYDEDRNVLELKFRTGRFYRYRNVPRDVYEQLVASKSSDSYFNDVIHSSYEAELVYDPHRPRIRS